MTAASVLRSCPSWCVRNHDGERYSHHGRPGGTAEDVSVALVLSEPMGVRRVYVATCASGSDIALLPLEDAGGMARILARLGHPQLAALITEAARIGSTE